MKKNRESTRKHVLINNPYWYIGSSCLVNFVNVHLGLFSFVTRGAVNRFTF